MKGNFKYLISFCTFINFSVCLAQNTSHSNVLEESSIYTGTSVEHKACEEIRLLPGYNYKAEANNQMRASIDPYLNCVIEYSSSSLSSDDLPPINTSLTVGTTAGQFDVSHTGAATYNVPITLPPGTNGFQPKLNIVYNSQSGDGLLGFGWNIAGLSSISRTGNVSYYDNSTSPIKLTNEDNFLLDGQRLFELSGANGANNTTYGTEVESFSQITSFGTAGTGPSYFVFENKEGLIMEYGNTADSKIEAQGSSTVFTWLLNKVTDAFGNFYTINYIEINNGDGIQNYPDFIEYTGNDQESLLPYNKIKFVYGERNDKNLIFIGGSAILNERLVTSLEVYTEQTLTREYIFTYNIEKGSKLIKIEENGANNEIYNPILISYDQFESFPTFEYQTVPASELPSNLQGEVSSITLDFNGDGIDDVVRLQGSNVTDIYTWELLNRNNNIITSGSCPEFDGALFTDKANHILDFNGDGYQDFIIFRGNSINSTGQSLSDPIFYFMESNKVDGFELVEDLSFNGNAKYIVGDFDGDAATDLFIYFYDSNQGYIYSYNKNQPLNLVLNSNIGDEKLSFYPTDFNGDGKHEVFYTFPNTFNDTFYSVILEYDGTALVNQSGTNGYPNLTYNSTIGEPKIFIGDFNGDRNSDLLVHKFPTGWEIAFSEGVYNEFTTVPCSLSGNPNDSNNPFQYEIVDLNGDGKSDVLVNAVLNNQISYSFLYFSDDYTFQSPVTISSGQNMNPIKGLQAGDFNGDAKKTYYYGNNDGSLTKLTFANSINQKRCTLIRNGLGHETKISYRTLAQLALEGNYNKLTDANYPVWDLTLPMTVVKSVEIENSVGTFNSINYSYGGSKLHVLGKGFLGFQKFTSVSESINIKNEFSYTFSNNSFYHPTLAQTKTISTINNSVLSSTDYTYSFLTNLLQGNPGSKRYLPFPQTTISNDFVNGNTSSTSINMDLSGNITQKQTDNGIELVQESFTFGSSCTTLPFANRLLSSQTTITRTGELPYTRSSQFEYNGLACSLSKKILDTGVEIIYSRDNFGNILSETIDSPNDDLPPSPTTYVYDDKGRFPNIVINALGHSAESFFDPTSGNIIKSIDPNGLVSDFAYDGFGRQVSSTSPTGVISFTSRNWAFDPQIHSVFSITESTSGIGQIKQYFSLNGEVVKNETQGFDGTLLSSLNTYNELGQKVSNSDLNNGLTTTYSYEPILQRLATITSPNGSVVSYTYNSNEIISTSTLDEIEKVNSEKFDASGKVIETFDDGGTISYTYFSSGNPKNITTPGNTSVNMLYDNFGRQTQLNDPGAGIMTYAYDEFDRLISQTDANGKTIEISYDVLGRTTKKEYSSGAIINYEYDPDGALGMLKLTQLIPGTDDGFIAHTTSYEYDDFQRLKEKTEQFDDKTLTHQLEYDQFGRVIKQTYPGGFVTAQEYNEFGFMNLISDGNQNSLWQCNGLTNRLQPQQSTYGENIGVDYAYGTYGELLQLQGSISNSSQSAILWQQNYTFDNQRGNLLSRSRANPFIEETFEYDQLDRLTQMRDMNQQAIHTVNYTSSNNGNIASKSDAGEYFYNSNQPFAIAELQHPAPSVSSALQQISYTAFNQPLQLTEGDYTLNYLYNADE